MKTLTLLAAALALTAGAPRPVPYVLQNGHIDLDRGPDGNTVILDTPQGLVVIDSGRHPEHAQAILDHARKVRKPVIAVVNTHWHLDHSTGNRDLLTAYPGAKVVASHAVEGALKGFLAQSKAKAEAALAEGKLDPAGKARVERMLAALNDPAALIPSLPIERDGPQVLGGRRIEFHLAHAAATEGDVWLTLPDEKIAIVGDLVVGPVPFFDTACEQGWARALEAISRERWTILIPGHGAPMNRAAFNRWRRAFTRYVDCAHSGAAPQACTAQWQADAASFQTAATRGNSRLLARYYVDEVLRAPADKRMAYCARPSLQP